ncbi:MAG: tRNA adenosine(34) deaminase TadA [Nitrospirota bacterium]
MEICQICEKSTEECICCPECGHICGLDNGENYCPVCFPKNKSSDQLNHKNEHYMHLALKEAEAAFIKGEVPVGAVLVKGNTVLAKAHNTKETKADPTAHAEITVIRDGASKIGDWRLTGATLYVTKEPCIMCAGAMANARLCRLVYGCRDERYGAVESRYQILSDKRLNHQVEVVSGIMENECAGILKKFFVKLRNTHE